MRLGPLRPIRWLTIAYVQFFQATPPLMQLFLVYYGGSYFGVRFEAWAAALIAFSLYSSAYLGDIWHGCIAPSRGTNGKARGRCRSPSP